MNFKSSFIAIIYLLIIPTIGFSTSFYIINYYSGEIGISVVDLCLGSIDLNADLKSACLEFKYIYYLGLASVISGLVAIGLLSSYIIISLVCGTNRKLISLIFPILIPLSTFLIAGLILVQGAIITYGAYILESFLIQRVHYFLIGGLGIGALLGSLKLLSSLFSFKRKLEMTVFATQISEDDNKQLWEFVKEIASKLNARIPDNIIIGLEPMFYATSADIKLVNDNTLIKGETLFLSIILMKLFSKQQLASVIGHELGHFIGNDTDYSMKFTPVYVGISSSVKALEEGESFVALPALAMLDAMLDIFSRNVSKISRIREFEADKVGISVSSNEDLAISLAKVSIFSSLWNKIREENINRLNEGKISGNLSKVFEASSRYDFSVAEIKVLLIEILKFKISHPTDTQPSINDRFINIGYKAEGLTIKNLSEVGNSSKELLTNSIEIEKNLTIFEHKFVIALGLATIPENIDDTNLNYLSLIYTLVATMIGADGKIDPDEIITSEKIGKKLFDGFDSVEFRNYCDDLDSLPEINNVVDLLGPSLNEADKNNIYEYLNNIANADNDLANEEKEILSLVRDKWKLSK